LVIVDEPFLVKPLRKDKVLPLDKRKYTHQWFIFVLALVLIIPWIWWWWWYALGRTAVNPATEYTTVVSVVVTMLFGRRIISKVLD